MKAMVRPVSAFAGFWVPIEGDTKEAVLAELRYAVAFAMSRSFVEMTTAEIPKSTIMKSTFTGPDEAHAFACDIKWSDDGVSERHVITLTRSEVQQELLTRLVTG